MSAGVFISYRREDAAGHVGRLYDALVAHLGRGAVFMDIDHIEPGQDFTDVLHRAVSACQVVLVVIGPRWLAAEDANGHRRLDDPSDFVRLEVAEALQRSTRVIPVLVHGARMPDASALPEPLKPLALRQALELRDQGWREGIANLMAAIDRVISSRRPAGRSIVPIAAGVTLVAGLAWWWLMSGGNAPREQTVTETGAGRVSGAAAVAGSAPAGGIVIDDTFVAERRLGAEDQPFFGNSAYCRTAYRPDGFLVEARSDSPCQYVIYTADFLPDPGRVSLTMRLMQYPVDPGQAEIGLGLVEALPADGDSALAFRSLVTGVDNYALMRDRRDEPQLLMRPVHGDFINANERAENTHAVTLRDRRLSWSINGRDIGEAVSPVAFSDVEVYLKGRGLQVVLTRLTVRRE